MSSDKINNWRSKMESYKYNLTKKKLKKDLEKAGFKISDKKKKTN